MERGVLWRYYDQMFPKSSSVGVSRIRINLAKGNIAVDAVLEAPKSPHVGYLRWVRKVGG